MQTGIAGVLVDAGEAVSLRGSRAVQLDTEEAVEIRAFAQGLRLEGCIAISAWDGYRR